LIERYQRELVKDIYSLNGFDKLQWSQMLACMINSQDQKYQRWTVYCVRGVVNVLPPMFKLLTFLTRFTYRLTFCIASTHIVLCFCFVSLRLVYHMLPVSLECSFLIASSVFSIVYFLPRLFINNNIITLSLSEIINELTFFHTVS
jgi:hypothetical protein